jgi:hypothetical protein
LRPIAFAIAVAGVVWAPLAVHADAVEDLIRTVRKDPDDKVRLSAALGLGKLGDKRAVPVFADVLEKDSAWRVRLVAAVALGKMVDLNVQAVDRDRAIDVLAWAQANDPEDAVRTQAQRSWEKVHAFRSTSVTREEKSDGKTTKASPPGVYVDTSAFKDATKGKKHQKLVEQMKASMNATFAQVSYRTTWASGAAPTDSELKKARVVGFYVDVRLVSIAVGSKDGMVECKAQGEVGFYPRKADKIEALAYWPPEKAKSYAGQGRSKKDIEASMLRCVSDLAAKMAQDTIPLISAKVSSLGSD